MSAPSRPQYHEVLGDAHKRLVNLNQYVERMADEHGVSHQLLELVKIRASHLNGCAYCTDLHVGRAGRDPDLQRDQRDRPQAVAVISEARP